MRRRNGINEGCTGDLEDGLQAKYGKAGRDLWGSGLDMTVNSLRQGRL